MTKTEAIIYATKKMKVQSSKRAAIYHTKHGWFTTSQTAAKIKEWERGVLEYIEVWPGMPATKLEIEEL